MHSTNKKPNLHRSVVIVHWNFNVWYLALALIIHLKYSKFARKTLLIECPPSECPRKWKKEGQNH